MLEAYHGEWEILTEKLPQMWKKMTLHWNWELNNRKRELEVREIASDIDKAW